MKKIIVTVLLIVSFFFAKGADKFVSVSGSGNRDGTTPSNSWTWAEGISQARAGDHVYVLAGNYGRQLVTQSADGTENNRIIFEGYTTTIGDIQPIEQTFTHEGRTYTFWSNFTRGEDPDGTKSPLFDGGNGNIAGTSLSAQGDYVSYINLSFKHFRYGVITSGSNVIFHNAYVVEMGNVEANHNEVTYIEGGFGMRFDNGGNWTVSRSYIRDCGSENITMASGTGNLMDQVFVESLGTQRGFDNSSDYYMSFAGTVSYSEMRDCVVYREKTNGHGGHGIDMKGASHHNEINNCWVINTYMEVIGTQSAYNVFTGGGIISGWYPNFQSGTEYGNIFAASGAHHNTFQNMELYGDFSPIRLRIYSDPSLGGNQGWNIHDNKFLNLVIRNSNNAIGFFESATFTGVGVYDNIFDGITIINDNPSGSLIRQNQPNQNNSFTNIIAHNVSTLTSGTQATLNTNTVFDRINLSGGSFAASALTPYTESNITEFDVTFDSQFKPTSGNMNIGLINSENPNDWDGNLRNNPNTLGAFDLDNAGTTGTPTTGTPTSGFTESILNFFVE